MPKTLRAFRLHRRQAFEALTFACCAVGLAFVIFARIFPPRDSHENTSLLAANLLYELLCIL
ncbi:MAG: hypothetical protein WA765_09535 [Candidatus Acidiferrum sp.]